MFWSLYHLLSCSLELFQKLYFWKCQFFCALLKSNKNWFIRLNYISKGWNQHSVVCVSWSKPKGIVQLKGSYDGAKKNIILGIWCNAMCLRGSRFKKHIILHILYIIVAPLCSAFLKRIDFYKAHRSEKRGVPRLASYPVHCDWPNTSSVWRKCYAPYHVVMPCPGTMRLKQ